MAIDKDIVAKKPWSLWTSKFIRDTRGCIDVLLHKQSLNSVKMKEFGAGYLCFQDFRNWKACAQQQFILIEIKNSSTTN